MKAIVLSCDKYVKFADHMITTYQNVWSSNPFFFRLPYENYPYQLKEKYGDKVELIHVPDCNSNIKLTVLTLLEDLDDEDWIYWCIDDKYPVEMEIHQVQEIYDWIASFNNTEISGVMFCRVRNLLNDKYLMLEQDAIFDSYKRKYLRRKDYSQIWIHQFLKVKVIRTIFNAFPNQDFSAKEMDSFKKALKLPEHHKLYVTQNNLAIFGESTSRGQLTLNCARSFQNLGWNLPKDFAVSSKEIILR